MGRLMGAWIADHWWHVLLWWVLLSFALSPFIGRLLRRASDAYPEDR